jgi:hypothetical protein
VTLTIQEVVHADTQDAPTASSSLNDAVEIWLRAANTQGSQNFPVKGLRDSSTALEPANVTNLEPRFLRAEQALRRSTS